MKKIVIILAGILIIILTAFFFLSPNEDLSKNDRLVLEKTLDISKDYATLRYQTDNVLLEAESYSAYDDWKNELDMIIGQWSDMEQRASELESLADEMADEKISFRLINSASAYNKQEISNVFDRAPAGKKIATLAKHLGVDAKRAYAILNQDQAQVQADAWNEAGDTFKKLETTAVVIKNTCKVTVFVGTIALTGGTSAIATGSTLAKTAVVVAGADLALEVTDDGAKIALGDKNKVSSIVGSARVVTEPAAAILMISTLPNNITKAIDKLSAVTFAADQLNTSIQEGKIIGIKLPAVTNNQANKTTEVSVLEKEEITEWLNKEAVSAEEPTIKDVEDVLGLNKEAEKADEVAQESNPNQTPDGNNNPGNTSLQNPNSIVGIWEGILRFTPNEEGEKQANYVLELNADSTVGGTPKNAYDYWKLEGDTLRLVASFNGSEGYDEFRLSGNSLTYVKRAGINSDGVWQEDYAGSDFFGGKFMEISLQKL